MLMGAEIVSKAIRIALVVFSARLLGDANYGKFTFALAFTTLFLILSDMGIHQLLVREIARKPDRVKAYLGNAFVIKFFLSALYFLLIVGIIILTNKPPEVVVAVCLLAVYQILVSFSLTLKSVFQAFQQMRYEAISTVLQSVLGTVMGITVLLLGGNFLALACMYLLGSVFTLVYCLVIAGRNFTSLSLEIDFPLIKFLFREGLPFGILFFFAMMYTYVSSVILSFMVNDEAVGWYNAAYRLVFALMFIPMGTMKAVFPVLSKYYKESMADFTRLFEKTFKVMFFIGFSLASLISLISDKIVLLLYGEEYINAAGALRILVWSTALIFVTTVMTHTTRSADRQRFTAKAVGFSAFLNLALNFILIPKYSYIGAALATLVTEGSTFLLHLVYLSTKLVKPPILKLAPKILAINLVMGIYVVFFMKVHIFLLVPTAVMVNFIMVVVTQYFSKEEFAFLKEVIRSSRS